MYALLALAVALLLAPADSQAFLRSTSILPVANDGSQFDRDTWNPTHGSFPGVGATYTDPVFGEVVTRLSSVYPDQGSALKAHHLWSADGVRFFWQHSGTHVLTTAGTQVETSIPGGFGGTEDAEWSPTNADLYYYTSGSQLWQRNVATDTTTSVKNFGTTLTGNGAKIHFLAQPADDTANPTNLLFVHTFGGTTRVWDQVRDTVLTGTMTNSDTVWVGISPDGRWLIRAGNTTQSLFSLPINVLTGTVGNGSTGQTGTNFWDIMCFDHADVTTLSTGKTYILTGACSYERWHYRVDVSLNQAGRAKADQAADNLRLFQTDASGQTGNAHYSCATQGAMRDYCWSSPEDFAETVAAPGTWYANKQEVLLIYMRTGQVFRFAHHRSYPIASPNFCANARVISRMDGTAAVFTSAMGLAAAEASCGYSDVYLLDGRSVTAQKPWTRRPHYQIR